MEDARLYMHIAEKLRAAIESGALAPGRPLPSVAALCGQFGCSRRTVGRALEVLDDEGLIVRYVGRGWNVAGPASPDGKADVDDPRLYMLIAGQLRDGIGSGDFSPGKPFLRIGEVCGRFGCSRRTAGHALGVLAGQGLLTRFAGRGWYVEDPLPDLGVNRTPVTTAS